VLFPAHDVALGRRKVQFVWQQQQVVVLEAWKTNCESENRSWLVLVLLEEDFSEKEDDSVFVEFQDSGSLSFGDGEACVCSLICGSETNRKHLHHPLGHTLATVPLSFLSHPWEGSPFLSWI